MTDAQPANPKPFVVPIDFNGETYQSRLTFGDLRRLRDDHDIDLFKGDADEVDADPAMVVLILWYALKHDQPDLSYADVEDNLDIGAISYLSERIQKLVGAGEGKAETGVKVVSTG